MDKTGLGDRMKGYENISRIKLQPKSYVIIRLDGKAFHTFTRGFNKPFDDKLINAMQESLKYISDNIMGFKVGYTQSDEASIIITDTDTIETQGYFDFNIQKLTSIISSMFTYKFNNILGIDKPAFFDCRVFTIPKEEVANYFIWRQRDWERNSIQMLCQSKFSQKQLHGKKVPDMHDMLHNIGINWNNLENVYKNGSFYFKGNINFEKHNYESINNLLINNYE